MSDLLKRAADQARVSIEQAEAVLNYVTDHMGWAEIRAMEAEFKRGQDVYEDAGGFAMRAYRRLFGLSRAKDEVLNYRAAIKQMVAKAATP